MDKKLNEAVAALRPQMVAALQRLVRRRSVEADPLPGKPFGEEVDACFAEALALCHHRHGSVHRLVRDRHRGRDGGGAGTSGRGARGRGLASPALRRRDRGRQAVWPGVH